MTPNRGMRPECMIGRQIANNVGMDVSHDRRRRNVDKYSGRATFVCNDWRPTGGEHTATIQLECRILVIFLIVPSGTRLPILFYQA